MSTQYNCSGHPQYLSWNEGETAFNKQMFLIDIPHELQDSSNPVKFMGIQWNHEEDSLSYLPVATSTGDKMTKRQLLSRIAKVYDPLGLHGFSDASKHGYG